ncbi:MAG: hypothetical protein ACI88A_000967 [Paraglaciecola sp.]|jgi:hypothetical protein
MKVKNSFQQLFGCMLFTSFINSGVAADESKKALRQAVQAGKQYRS